MINKNEKKPESDICLILLKYVGIFFIMQFDNIFISVVSILLIFKSSLISVSTFQTTEEIFYSLLQR